MRDQDTGKKITTQSESIYVFVNAYSHHSTGQDV